MQRFFPLVQPADVAEPLEETGGADGQRDVFGARFSSATPASYRLKEDGAIMLMKRTPRTIAIMANPTADCAIALRERFCP